ncbi:MAG: formylmethanofuran--tetrahydromethanopterin N-formyltransferase [Planctomycetes bacterium]|nr:formylmethanofuran--tetrahydromethanopterin N-formyltransferase [Planctomycetota bacterium]
MSRRLGKRGLEIRRRNVIIGPFTCTRIGFPKRDFPLQIGPTTIDDTFAEAFGMRYARVLVTAHDEHWLGAAVQELSGYGSSVIACDAEVGLEQPLTPEQTPDGRLGASLLIFGFSTEALAAAAANRVGQCVMTCPSTAVFDGLHESTERIALGKQLRYFGDGFQKSKQVAGRRYWRIPVMDGEFLIEESLGVAKGVAGGNIIIQAATMQAALDAARRGVEAVAELPGTITPFPGGTARSGSKVGSRYKKLKASTADAYCPTLRGRVESKLHEGVNCCLEIVIDGVDEAAVGQAMGAAMRASAGEGVVAISAGNYGGKLGKFHFKLHELG